MRQGKPRYLFFCWLIVLGFGSLTVPVTAQTLTGGALTPAETLDVPSDYLVPMEGGGQIVEVHYDSLDYASEGTPSIEKTAFVYLPAGYDASDTSQSYPILYLMHGWRMTAGDFFQRSDLKAILDHMIEAGDIAPLIMVTPTFDAENLPQDFRRSEAEIRNFHQDFRYHLMPYIEGTYHTYAQGVTDEDLQASRHYRAFAGFSGGSVTTWSQFRHNLDYIQYFGPMSGDSWDVRVFGGRDQTKDTVDLLEEAARRALGRGQDYFIYAATGTEDFAADLITPMVTEMQQGEAFSVERLAFAKSTGSQHNLLAVQEYLYNMLPLFFDNRR